MAGEVTDTILVICNDEQRSRDILERLFDNGIGVVGPVASAALALALTAQSAPTLALVAESPNGRRKARELARELMDTWGVRSVVLEAADDAEEAAVVDAHWAPRPGQLERLRKALGDSAVFALS